jgi:hypothetical protein
VLGATGPHGDGGAPVPLWPWKEAEEVRLGSSRLLVGSIYSGCAPKRRIGDEQGGGRNCRAAAATLCSCAARARRGPAQAGRRLGRGARVKIGCRLAVLGTDAQAYRRRTLAESWRRPAPDGPRWAPRGLRRGRARDAGWRKSRGGPVTKSREAERT